MSEFSRPLSTDQIAGELIKERQRQITEKGYAPSHDDMHRDGSLALAAACYATPIPLYKFQVNDGPAYSFNDPFPWWDGDGRQWKPLNKLTPNGQLEYGDRRRMLVKAGALIIAEIERLDRVEQGEKDIEGLTNG